MKMFRCRIRDAAFPSGSGEVLVNLDQVVWMGAHPDEPATTLVKLTGDANVLLILASLVDVQEEMDA